MAVLTTFTIGSLGDVRDNVVIRTLRIEKRLGGRSVASFRWVDPAGNAGSNRPELRERVYIALDGTAAFLGIVWRFQETHVIATRGLSFQVDCVDYAALLEQVYFNGGLPAGFLHEVVEPLVANMAAHGIVQDPAVVQPGPVVGAQSFPFVTIAQAANDLALESGWVWRVAPILGTQTPAFGFFEVGTIAAPQAFTDAVGRVERAVFTADLSKYVNEIWVRYGEGEVLVTQRLNGDGSTREWRLDNDMTLPYPGNVQVVRAGGSTDETFDTDYINGTFAWHYDRANVWNQRIVHDSGQTVLAAGEYADLTYTARFPNAVLARDDAEYLGNGPFTRVEDLPAVFDRATALAYAQALLRQRGGTPKTGRIRTAVAGYEPLQQVSINLPNIGVSTADFLITEVVATHRETSAGSVHHFVYDVAVIEGNEAHQNWLGFYLPPRRNRGFGVVPPDGAGGVGGEQPPTTTPGAEYVTTGLTCYPIGARGVAVDTSSAAAWTNTSWIEIMPASAAPSNFWCLEGLHVESIQDISEQEFDIGLGPAGSEQVVATIRVGGNTTQQVGVLWLPIPHGPIAPGTRVAVRSRYDDEAAQAVDNQWVKILYLEAQPTGITTTTRTLKVAPSASGLTVTAPSTAWLDGSWVEVTAATTEPWQLAVVAITEGGATFNTSGDEIEIDVGVGAAASEVVKTTVRMHIRQGAIVSQGVVLDPILINQIPIGSRVAVRARHRRASSETFNFALGYYGGTF